VRRLLLTGAVAAAALASAGAGAIVLRAGVFAGRLLPAGEAAPISMPARPYARPFTFAPPGRSLPAGPASLEPRHGLLLQRYRAQAPEENHAFYFTRGIYSSYGGSRRWGGGSWSTDWPKSDQQFNVVLRRLTNIDSYLDPHAVALDDPALLRYPYLYILEVGRIALTPGEVSNLRDYLLKGGFLVVDDFWGDYQWAPFEEAMRQVLPEYQIEPLPLDNEYFKGFYNVDEVLQVPNVNNARRGFTSECPGCYPQVFGIFDARHRLMVVINWNTDLGDAWEWAEQPDYPVKYSTYAFKIGVNSIIYAMSH